MSYAGHPCNLEQFKSKTILQISSIFESKIRILSEIWMERILNLHLIYPSTLSASLRSEGGQAISCTSTGKGMKPFKFVSSDKESFIGTMWLHHHFAIQLPSPLTFVMKGDLCDQAKGYLNMKYDHVDEQDRIETLSTQ
jgi:hypothetical protein